METLTQLKEKALNKIQYILKQVQTAEDYYGIEGLKKIRELLSDIQSDLYIDLEELNKKQDD